MKTAEDAALAYYQYAERMEGYRRMQEEKKRLDRIIKKTATAYQLRQLEENQPWFMHIRVPKGTRAWYQKTKKAMLAMRRKQRTAATKSKPNSRGLKKSIESTQPS